MGFRSKIAALAVAGLAMGGFALQALPASASTQTCNSCIHVQNNYAFRGALDAVHQATAVNSPISLWYETPSTTDSGADLLGVDAGTVTESLITSDHGDVNQSGLNWYDYLGDSVVRFKYDPYGNGGANTYIGLNGQLGNGTSLALRNDNPNSVWQEFIEVPVNAAGVPDGCAANVLSDLSTCTSFNDGIADTAGVPDACGSIDAGLSNTPNDTASDVVNAESNCVLIDVGQTKNPQNPMVVTDPGDAFTGSLVTQVVAYASINQNSEYASNQVWNFED